MIAPSPLSELDELDRLIEQAGPLLRVQVAREVACGPRRFPVLALALGNPDPSLPAIGVFGGVHGLERIGAAVAIAHLRSVVERLRWDNTLHRQLEGLRMVFMPLINPAGTWLGTRANPQGVDLMRNAPIEAQDRVPFMVGGQRLSAALPWYRGVAGAPMQPEAQAVCEVVEAELLGRPWSIAIDCHSGFGMRDRLWFPYAHTRRPIDHLGELQALVDVFDRTHPHHRYLFEPQSHQYLAHGDRWDHLYRQSLARYGAFVPLTLEMGSWLWVKKNPRQLFSRHGIFNPLIEHRQQRVLRRHLALLDFLGRAAESHARWLPHGEARQAAARQALMRWYGAAPP